MRKELGKRGALEAVRSDLARGKALQFLVDHATVVDEAGNPVDLTLPEGEAAPESASADTDIPETDPSETAPSAAGAPADDPTDQQEPDE